MSKNRKVKTDELLERLASYVEARYSAGVRLARRPDAWYASVVTPRGVILTTSTTLRGVLIDLGQQICAAESQPQPDHITESPNL